MDRTRLLFILSLVVLPLAARSESLIIKPEDLPRLLNERNQAIRGAELHAEASERRTGHLVRSYLPSVHFELGGEAFQSGPYDVFTQPYGMAEGRINLFRGGKDLLEDRSLNAQARASSAQADRARASRLEEARRTYWTLVYQREQIQILKFGLEENSKNLAAANRRIQRGVSPDTDRLDFQINESQIQEEIESITHQILQTQILLRSFLVLEDDVQIETESTIPHDHDEKLAHMRIDMAAQPDVVALQAGRDVARNEESQLGRWWLPSIDAYAGYYLYTLRDRDYPNPGLRDDSVAGIRLSLPLFDGFQSTTAKSAASLRADGLEEQTVQATRESRARFQVAQEGMKHEHELIHLSESRIEQGKTYLSKTLSEYDRGVKNAPDVLNASQRLLGFRRRFSEIRKNYQFAKAEALSILGRE